MTNKVWFSVFEDERKKANLKVIDKRNQTILKKVRIIYSNSHCYKFIV